MTPEIIQRIAFWLSRGEYKGTEFAAYGEVMQALQAELTRQTGTPPAETPADGT